MYPIIESMEWRAAIKQYDTTKKLTDVQLTRLLEATRLSASSYGLQPYTLVIVNDPSVRTKLRAAAYDQAQVTDASHLVVFTVPTNLTSEHVEAFMQDIVKTRGVTRESLQGYADMINGVISSRSQEQNTQWAAKQAYIALGTLLTVAAIDQIDVTPMEGFDPKQFDEILGLTEKGLASVVIATLGFRADGDAYAQMVKVRKSREEFFITV